MRRILLFLFFGTTLIAHQQPEGVFILIHGTWGIDSDWYLPDGAFFKTLAKEAQQKNYKVVSFAWNGRIDHDSRSRAAAFLIKLIQSYPSTMKICLVAHSHGGNIAIIASQMLNTDPHNQHTITSLFTMGTPVSIQAYMPDMRIIKKVYNLFSFEDMVQPILGFFGREFPKHPSIANLRVFINSREPSHKELASPLIARWIPHMHEELAKKKEGNFDQFDFTYPGVIHFYTSGTPRYYIEPTRKEIVKPARQMQAALAAKAVHAKAKKLKNKKGLVESI